MAFFTSVIGAGTLPQQLAQKILGVETALAPEEISGSVTDRLGGVRMITEPVIEGALGAHKAGIVNQVRVLIECIGHFRVGI